MEGLPPAWIRWIVLVLLGALTGFISGMMGVGGGSFMVPMMVRFRRHRPAYRPGHLPAGDDSRLDGWGVDPLEDGEYPDDRLPGLVAGVLAGVFVGGSFAHLIPERELGLVYTALLLYTALRYLRVKPGQDAVCALKEGQG